MARSVIVDESIECAGLGSGEVSELLLAIATGEYRTVSASADRLQFSRSFRPLWSVILGIVLLPLVVGIFILMIRSTENWTATIEADHRTVRLRLHGQILPQSLLQLRSVMAEPSSRLVQQINRGLVSDPVVTPVVPNVATAPGGASLPPPPPSLPPPPLPPVLPTPMPAIEVVTPQHHAQIVDSTHTGKDLQETSTRDRAANETGAPEPVASAAFAETIDLSDTKAFPLDDDGRTVLRSELTQLRTSNETNTSQQTGQSLGFSVEFNTGQTVTVDGLVLVGRNPQPRPGDTEPTLVALDTHSQSISKTHLALEVLSGQLYVTDRGSTNGTEIAVDGGNSTKIAPEQPVRLERGSSVNFGDCSFNVNVDDRTKADLR